jgi:hypothetical protein
LAAGCATAPNVRYHQLGEGARPDSWVLFRLTDSVIAIGTTAKADAAKDGLTPPASLAPAELDCDTDGCGDVAVAVAPADFDGALYAIEPTSRHLVSTSIAPAYQPNSLRLKTLSVEAKDHRLEAINTIGAIATGAAKLGLTGRSTADPTASPAKPVAKIKLHLPVTIDLADADCEAPEMATCGLAIVADPADPSRHGTPQPLPQNPGWTYTLRFLDNPRASGLVRRAAIGEVHGAMVASTCRPVTIEITRSAGGVAPIELRADLADPDWLQTAPFPAKGAVVFHTLCGIDVQAQATTDIGTDALATAFFNNVQAVRSAQKK